MTSAESDPSSAPDESLSAPAVEEYDLVVIGSGEGSKFLAWTLAREGQRVAVVERRYIGGSCPNIACLPSKNVIHSAKVASYFRRGDEFGVHAHGAAVNMTAVRDRKRQMVAELVAIHVDNFRKSGAELVMGTGRFVDWRTVQITAPDGKKRRLRGTNVVIGTGTHATVAPVPGLREARPLTHVEALELSEVPAHLIVLGAGYIGLELAQAMRRFGSRVTLVDRNDCLVRNEDDDVREGLLALLADEGIDLTLNADVTAISGLSGEAVQVAFDIGGVRKTLDGTHLLVAAGRTPNTENLGLELADVELTERGFVKVDNTLRTTAEGVWAIGEVAGTPMFTHAAYDDFRVIRDNLKGVRHVTTGRQIPFCLFTDPELARVGLNETQARASGTPYRLFKVPMAADLRTRTLSETRGFLKALVAVDSDRILGFTAFGVDAGEIMGAIQMAMLGGLPYTAVRDAIITHPTLLEGLVVLFSSAPTVHPKA